MNRVIILNDWELNLLVFYLQSPNCVKFCDSINKLDDLDELCGKVSEALRVKK